MGGSRRRSRLDFAVMLWVSHHVIMLGQEVQSIEEDRDQEVVREMIGKYSFLLCSSHY